MISAPVFKTQNYLLNCILPDGKSRAGTDDTTEENRKLHNIIQWSGPCQEIWGAPNTCFIIQEEMLSRNANGRKHIAHIIHKSLWDKAT